MDNSETHLSSASSASTRCCAAVKLPEAQRVPGKPAMKCILCNENYTTPERQMCRTCRLTLVD
jgi:hypothetical protein